MYTIKDYSSSVLPKASEIALELKPNDYATCISDSFWWLVLVDSINVVDKDVVCKFYHPDYPTNNIHCLCTGGMGHVPINKFSITVHHNFKMLKK